jgi:eukaryotic-like serine/threonine-protein kinase
MSLAAGVRIGPYEVQSALGAGGMGEVWRARDTKLHRDVALKVLPDVFALDPDRLARFQREAQLLASLNHPGIAGIHGFEDSGGLQALVLELVEGPTLADRLTKGPIPLGEAIPIARQIAEALEAAHEHGIVHRDLKPSNIKLRADGAVKVLDFGLAKAFDTASHVSDVSQSPTLTSPAFTGVGVILGTAAYMAPEQARGKPVDKRSDIWAFGVVLYEMLTGARPFKGETVTDVLAAVIERPPDLDRVPARVRPLLRRCLEKDPARRLRDIGDAMALLEETPPAPEPVRQPVRPIPWIAAAVGLALLAGVALWAPWRTAPPPAEPIRTQVYLPEDVDAASRNFTLSPDGRVLAFSAMGTDRIPRVWVRFMESLEVRSLPGTETTQTPPQFFWSPDSKRIAYSAKTTEQTGKLHVVDLTGSPPQHVADTMGPNATGGSWNDDGVIVMGSTNGPLTSVSASGGVPTPITVVDVARKDRRHAFPTFLPDGRHFVYLRTNAVPENSGVYVGSIDAKPEAQDDRRLIATAFGPVYVASVQKGRGHLLILRDGNVLAQEFDEGRLEIVGDPVTVVTPVGAWLSSGFFSASGGVLVYRSSAANQDTRLQWWDRGGTFAATPAQPGGVGAMALSPDGERIALVRPDPTGPTGEISIWDTARGNSARLTAGPGRPDAAVWTPDGLGVVFASNREGPLNLYRKLADGSKEDEALLKSSQDKTPTSISADGRFLLYTQTDPQTKKDVWVLSNPDGSAGDHKAAPFQKGAFDESEARFSPDPGTAALAGPRWVTYTSNESGRNEVYVREFPLNTASGVWLVSKGAGGSNPRWRRDGKELFFAAPDGSVMSVDVTPGATFQHSEPKLLVRVPSGIRPNWDVTPDGQRFLVLVNVQQAAPFTVLQNWQSTLKR